MSLIAVISQSSISMALVAHNWCCGTPLLDFETDCLSDGRDWTWQSDWTGLLFFTSSVLLSTTILFLLLSSSVSLSYFNLAVPMSKCLRKHSCMSYPFSIAILNLTFSLLAPILFCGDVPAIKQLNYYSSPGAQSMAFYVREGFRSFRQRKLVCSCHESCVFRVLL